MYTEELEHANDPVIPVRRKPAKCRHCGSKVLRILYGEPTEEA